jgi:hypothetical protein
MQPTQIALHIYEPPDSSAMAATYFGRKFEWYAHERSLIFQGESQMVVKSA